MFVFLPKVLDEYSSDDRENCQQLCLQLIDNAASNISALFVADYLLKHLCSGLSQDTSQKLALTIIGYKVSFLIRNIFA